MNVTQTKNYEIIARLNESVQVLHSRLYPEYFKDYNFEDISDFYKGIIDNPNYIFLIIEEDNYKVGYAWIEIKNYVETAFKKPYKSIYVHQVSIVESERGKGYGLKLMENIYQIAKAKQINRIELDYWVDNEVAKEFYRKSGFKKYREFVYKGI